MFRNVPAFRVKGLALVAEVLLKVELAIESATAVRVT